MSSIKIKKSIFILLALLLLLPLNMVYGNSNGEKHIVINLPAFSVRLFDGDKLIKEWRCRVGKLSSKTIMGSGYISKKFSPTYFRYSKGKKKGEIIEYSRIRKYIHGPVLKTIKIPYHSKIRGLEITINGRITGQIIHSTTNPETIGHVYSHGCVGMYEDDMLELYDLVPENTRIDIIYKLVEFDGKNFHFYRNIYNKNSNIKDELHRLIIKNKILITPSMENILLLKGLAYGKVNLDKFMNSFL